LTPPFTGTGTPELTHLMNSIETIIKGKGEVVRLSVIALLAEGHLLIEDVPGVGKTTLAHTLAQSFHCSFRRLQFTSDLLPSDILGVTIFNQKSQEFEFRRGPIFANFILADELNRTTPKTQSALLEVMNEGQVTVDNTTYPMLRPFMVIATQNPLEHQGTYPLPESQLDRFLMRIRMGYPDPASEKEILISRSRNDNGPRSPVEPVLSAGDVIRLQKSSHRIHLEDSLYDYLLAIITATRRSPFFTMGVSPRGSLSLLRSAQAAAVLNGRDYCVPDDIKSLVQPVLAHRLALRSHRVSQTKPTEEIEGILREILEQIPVPF